MTNGNSFASCLMASNEIIDRWYHLSVCFCKSLNQTWRVCYDIATQMTSRGPIHSFRRDWQALLIHIYHTSSDLLLSILILFGYGVFGKLERFEQQNVCFIIITLPHNQFTDTNWNHWKIFLFFFSLPYLFVLPLLGANFNEHFYCISP